jgi:hypothetical protein
MSKEEKPLPKPPGTPFGRKKSFVEEENNGSLMADRMAMAMSEGKLEEFFQKELPDNENARKLAEMVMGLTGMMPAGFPGKLTRKEDPAEKTGTVRAEEQSSGVQPPEDVVNAVKGADMNSLVKLLKREHKKRMPEGRENTVEEKKRESDPSQPTAALEKEILEELLKIAYSNNLSLDWIFFRALKRYVDEYKETGNI